MAVIDAIELKTTDESTPLLDSYTVQATIDVTDEHAVNQTFRLFNIGLDNKFKHLIYFFGDGGPDASLAFQFVFLNRVLGTVIAPLGAGTVLGGSVGDIFNGFSSTAGGKIPIEYSPLSMGAIIKRIDISSLSRLGPSKNLALGIRLTAVATNPTSRLVFQGSFG